MNVKPRESQPGHKWLNHQVDLFSKVVAGPLSDQQSNLCEPVLSELEGCYKQPTLHTELNMQQLPWIPKDYNIFQAWNDATDV